MLPERHEHHVVPVEHLTLENDDKERTRVALEETSISPLPSLPFQASVSITMYT